jgi:hypothetical protein
MKQFSCHYCDAVYPEYQASCSQCGANLVMPDATEGKSKTRIWLESLSNRGFIALGLFAALAVLLVYFAVVPNYSVKSSVASQANSYKTRANLGKVFSQTMTYRVMLSEYYMNAGKFPDSKEQFEQEFGEIETDSKALIQAMELQGKGTIKIALGEAFQKDKYVKLKPNISHQGTIKWQCETNLSQQEIGPKSLDICRSVKL